MSTATQTIDLGGNLRHPYLQTFIALAILTVIEVFIGSLPTETFVTIVLVIIAVSKAALVFLIFMHAKYSKSPRVIFFIVFTAPLIGATFLTLTIWKDYRK